ncbi:MAG: serine/threonine-protein kinase [Planctomycetota bacterium]
MTKSRDFLGPYRLARLIRAGSTAQVWEAIHAEGGGERFALKILNQASRTDKGELAALKHEFAVGKDMKSPRIIHMHEHRVDNATPYLVLELFSELNLKQALRRGPDSLAFMVDKIVEQAAEGLYYMHTKGWIHRDIKPDNYLVSRDGTVKLIDFTIAEKKRSGLSKMMYKAKTVQGTRSYMSPEQIRGKYCDERSDLYSFGCVLFEVVTGKPPFTGQTPNDLLSKHLNASIPSPIVHNDNVTKDFANMTKRLMAKKVEDRPPSVWEFLKEFRSMQVWRKKPRRPEISVFDDMPGIKGADDMLLKGRPKDKDEDDDDEDDNKEEVA